MNTRSGAHRYELRSVLGEGGMGRVYLAWDPNLDREVALKVTLFRGEEAPELLERFLREARLTARLAHPGVVQVFDAGTLEDGRAVYAMQRVQGNSLRTVLKRPPLSNSLRRRIEVLLRVCEIVAFAHECGIVHRDLKPANIMLGDFGEVFVADWGLALAQGEQDAALSGAGTPRYMSPEQAEGMTSEPAQDVFSLGAILAGLLGAASAPGGEWAPPPDASPSLVQLARRGLSTNPALRPGAADFGLELRRWLDNTECTLIIRRTFQTGSEAQCEAVFRSIHEVGKRHDLQHITVVRVSAVPLVYLSVSRYRDRDSIADFLADPARAALMQQLETWAIDAGELVTLEGRTSIVRDHRGIPMASTKL
jgi:serine/threonine protein kinase